MAFGFRNLIKIGGKTFFNLSTIDVADMIDAYLSGGDDKFENEALPEFMLIPNETDELEKLREAIEDIDRRCREPDALDGLASIRGREELTALSRTLRDDPKMVAP